MRTVHRHIFSSLVPGFLPLLLCAPELLAQAAWTRIYPATTPTPRYSAAMAFDTVRGRCVMFGGYDSNPLAQVWLFDGVNWQQSFAASPSARGGHQMVFDEARGVVVLFGGITATNYTNETWEWNGTTWTQRLPAQSPSARIPSGLAYDRQRQVTVMFGGYAASTAFGDTWEWNGSNWVQRTPAQSPPVRTNSAMTFDPVLGGVMLFGGVSQQNQALDDQWRWNGTTWTRQFPAHPPYARWGHAMVADVTRRRVALVGDTAANDPLIWEWDGVDWTTVFQPSPSPRWQLAFAHDSQRGMNVLFGGSVYSSTQLGDTWKWQTATMASSTSFGAGCAGSAGTPVLANAPYTLPWLGDTMRTRVNTVPASLGALFVSSLMPTSPISLDTLGMPGCNLLVSADVLEFRTASGGVAEWTLAIPNTPTLVGLSFQQQALPLDPAANALGLAASNALTLQLGVR